MPDIRVLEPEQYRAACDLFLATVHQQPLDDALWEQVATEYTSGRGYGAFDGDELIGCAGSLASALQVPGGAELPMAAVTNVGVRSDHTRKGVLTALMRAQLDGCAASGEPVAALRASEPGIYGRFGYGIATRQVTVTVDKTKAGVSNPGTVRQLPLTEARKRLPALHERAAPARAGSIRRPDGWWAPMLAMHGKDAPLTAVVHQAAGGAEDGYALYTAHRDGHDHRLVLQELWAADAAGYVDLWRYVLSVDLVGEVSARKRPLDEQLDLLLGDPRAARVTDSGDETWLRLVDVPAALAGRTYGDGSIVLGVRDTFLPGNTGSYRIGAGGVRKVAEDAELHCTVDTLAMLYLGDRSPAALAEAGRLTGDAEALRRAASVFGTGQLPWCGTQF